MKKYVFLLLSMSLGTAVWAQNVLLPKAFIYHQNEQLELQNIDSTAITDANLEKVYFFDAGKKKPLSVEKAKDVERKITQKGLMLLAFNYKNEALPRNADSLKTYFQNQNFLFLADSLKQTFKTKTADLQVKTSQKVLFLADKAFGNLYNFKIGQDLEILLEQNPYYALYGDDITGQVWYKGKPLAYAPVRVQNSSQKDISENQPITTDTQGKFYFKTNRLGVWSLECYHWDVKDNPNVIQHALYYFESVK